MSDQLYPRNIQEFLDQGWEKNIYYRISAFSLKDTLNNPEDLKQEILCSLLKTDYLSRYDTSKGAFKTYLYSFIDNFLKKKYNKEHTRHGKYIVSAASLSTLPPDDENEEFDGTQMYLDLMMTENMSENTVVFNMLIDDIRKELKENFKSNSSHVHNGVTYERDPATVFDLMLNGATVMDVANILDVSRQFVYHLLKTIRTSSAYTVYLNSFGEK